MIKSCLFNVGPRLIDKVIGMSLFIVTLVLIEKITMLWYHTVLVIRVTHYHSWLEEDQR